MSVGISVAAVFLGTSNKDELDWQPDAGEEEKASVVRELQLQKQKREERRNKKERRKRKKEETQKNSSNQQAKMVRIYSTLYLAWGDGGIWIFTAAKVAERRKYQIPAKYQTLRTRLCKRQCRCSPSRGHGRVQRTVQRQVPPRHERRAKEKRGLLLH